MRNVAKNNRVLYGASFIFSSVCVCVCANSITLVKYLVSWNSAIARVPLFLLINSKCVHTLHAIRPRRRRHVHRALSVIPIWYYERVRSWSTAAKTSRLSIRLVADKEQCVEYCLVNVFRLIISSRSKYLNCLFISSGRILRLSAIINCL